MTVVIDHKAVKYISFDLYGTLFVYDDLAASWQSWARELYGHMQSIGYTADFAAFHQHCDAFFSQNISPLEQHTVFSTRIVKFAQLRELSINQVEANKIADLCCQAWHEHISLHPHAISILQYLESQYALFLVTNFDHPPFVRKMLKKMKIARYFSEIIISGELGVKKPERAIFDSLRNSYDIQKNNCIHVGDSLDDYHFSTNNDLIPLLIGEKGEVNGVIDYAFNCTEYIGDSMVVNDLVQVGKVLGYDKFNKINV